MSFLLKVFEKEEYADDLFDGKLFINSLSYFKNLSSDDGNRGDSSEGVFNIIETDFIEIEASNGFKNKAKLASPLKMNYNWGHDLKLYCMYLMNFPDFITDSSTPESLREETLSRLGKLNFGRYGVVIGDLKKFAERVELEAKKKGYAVAYKAVEYYSNHKLPFSSDPRTGLFLKSDSFAHQSEYRFCFYKSNDSDLPLIIDIGSLEDIALKVDMNNLSDTFHFKLTDQE